MEVKPGTRPSRRGSTITARHILGLIIIAIIVVQVAFYFVNFQGGDEASQVLHPKAEVKKAFLDVVGDEAPTRVERSVLKTVGPANVNWTGIDDGTRMRTAGFYTPYHITLGGGERYLLSSIKAAQYIGFHVEVLVGPDNVCQSVEKLMEVSRIMRIELNPWLTHLRTVQVTDHLILAHARYDLFFLLGNEKYPMYRGLGRMNMYMCQFPFDLDRVVDVNHLIAFASYDIVLLNSLYSLKWYQHFITPVLKLTSAANGLFPLFEILHPAVVPFQASSGPRANIILLGRLFAGRQSKGHHIAIKLFKALRPDLPPETRLILAGNVWPGEQHERYVADLRQEAAGWPIDFLLGQSAEVIQQALQSSLVQWHMTGLAAYSRNDPADHEHFGISIVEGMSAGCLPIAYCVGGASDIISPDANNGYLACSEEEFVSRTRALFNASQKQHDAMRASGLRTAARFDVETFKSKFITAIFRGFLSLSVRHYIKQVQPTLRSIPVASAEPVRQKHKAVIIEGRVHHAFEFVCRKTLLHLGPDWSLHVFHTRMNDAFVHEVLQNVPGVQFSLLDTDVISIPYYNHLLKSMAFWDQMGVDKVLLFQVDTLILHPFIDPFLAYDFVGAPWHEGNERWKGLLRDMLPEGVGNGGFSLRTVEASKDVVRRFGAGSPDDEQEDMFFAINMRRLGYKIAPRSVAYEFCIEVPCMDVPQPKAHFAMHAAWYYAARSQLRHTLDDTLPLPVYNWGEDDQVAYDREV